MKCLTLFCVAATLIFSPLSRPETQAAVEALTLKDLCLRSPLIVQGRVVSSKVHWVRNQHSEVIVTDYTVALDEVLKSDQPESLKTLTLRCVGGRIGDTALLSPEEPSVRDGESVALFLRLDPEVGEGGNIYKTYGGFQGKFSLLGDRVRESRDRTWADLRHEISQNLLDAKKK